MMNGMWLGWVGQGGFDKGCSSQTELADGHSSRKLAGCKQNAAEGKGCSTQYPLLLRLQVTGSISEESSRDCEPFKSKPLLMWSMGQMDVL